MVRFWFLYWTEEKCGRNYVENPDPLGKTSIWRAVEGKSEIMKTVRGESGGVWGGGGRGGRGRIKRRQKRQFRFRDTHISQILAQDCYFELLLLDSNDSYPLFNILSARSHSNNWLFNSRHRKTWNDGRKKSERKFGKKKSWIKFNFSHYINSIYEITLGKSGGFLVSPIFSFCHF